MIEHSIMYLLHEHSIMYLYTQGSVIVPFKGGFHLGHEQINVDIL